MGRIERSETLVNVYNASALTDNKRTSLGQTEDFHFDLKGFHEKALLVRHKRKGRLELVFEFLLGLCCVRGNRQHRRVVLLKLAVPIPVGREFDSSAAGEGLGKKKQNHRPAFDQRI